MLKQNFFKLFNLETNLTEMMENSAPHNASSWKESFGISLAENCATKILKIISFESEIDSSAYLKNS